MAQYTMRRLVGAILAGWLATLGCSSATRDRLRQWFFEIPVDDEPADAAVADGAPVPEAVMPAGFDPPQRFVSTHPPFVLRQCDACHGPAECMAVGDEMIESCRTCHAAYFVESITHQPVQLGMCTECHDMHRSTLAALLKDETHTLCAECHDEPEELSEPVHAVSGVERCTACHDPHFGTAPYLKPEPEIAIPKSSGAEDGEAAASDENDEECG